MSAHTPGPWVAEQRTPKAAFNNEPYWRVLAADGSMMYVGNGASEDEADARLIAAAPCLLAALRNLLDSTFEDGAGNVRDISDCLDSRLIDAARAAIAKAVQQ
jgi:hypothetical protein